MEAMRLREGRRELDGRVEIDDACPGGERSGGKTGRGAVAGFATNSIAPSVAVVCDGPGCFRQIQLAAARHRATVTHGSKAAVQLPRLRAVNRLLGNLTTAVAGTHTAFRFAKCAHRYLAGFHHRFDRRFDNKTFPRLLLALVAAPASPEGRLRGAEIARQSGEKMKAGPWESTNDSRQAESWRAAAVARDGGALAGCCGARRDGLAPQGSVQSEGRWRWRPGASERLGQGLKTRSRHPD